MHEQIRVIGEGYDAPWPFYAADAKPDKCAPAIAIYVGLCEPEKVAL
jgi:hypothetical protein